MRTGTRSPIRSTLVCLLQPSLLVGLIATAVLGGALSRLVARAVMASDVADTIFFTAGMLAGGMGLKAVLVLLLAGCGAVGGILAGTFVSICHRFVHHRSVHVRKHYFLLYLVCGAAMWGSVLGLGYSIWHMPFYWFLRGGG